LRCADCSARKPCPHKNPIYGPVPGTSGSGNFFVDGVDINLLTDKEIQNYRTHYVGMVTTNDNIMPNLTIAENMALGTAFGRIKPNKETLAVLYTSLGLLNSINVPAYKCSKEEQI